MEGFRSGEGLADGVYETVKAMVMDHVIAPGARMSIEGLARELAVSATPVREALARLEADGLVVRRPQAGYRATDLLDTESFADLFDMRLLLEPRAAYLAAENATGSDLDRLEVILTSMRSHPDTGEDYAGYRGFVTLDQDFHNAIAAATGRPLLADAIERLHAHLHVFRLNTAPGAAGPTVEEHDRVLVAIERRNPVRAAEAMEEHLRSSRVRHRPRIQSPGTVRAGRRTAAGTA